RHLERHRRRRTLCRRARAHHLELRGQRHRRCRRSPRRAAAAALMAERLVLANARLIDCVAPDPRPASVVIDRGRIVEILDGRPAVSGATVIDLAGLYLLPGLWD